MENYVEKINYERRRDEKRAALIGMTLEELCGLDRRILFRRTHIITSRNKKEEAPLQDPFFTHKHLTFWEITYDERPFFNGH